MSSGAVLTDAAKVRLEALRREAAADRDIYEKFLSRNKATGELALINSDNIKVISPAVPPLRSSRPSIMILAPVLGLLGAVAATTALAIGNRPAIDRLRRRHRLVGPDGPPPSGEPMPRPQAPANDPERPEWQPMRARRESNALLAMADEARPQRSADRRVADPHRPAAKSLLMMAETMRDAAGDTDGDGRRQPPGARRFGW